MRRRRGNSRWMVRNVTMQRINFPYRNYFQSSNISRIPLNTRFLNIPINKKSVAITSDIVKPISKNKNSIEPIPTSFEGIYKDIGLKIIEIKKDIEVEIERRKNIIRKSISSDEICFQKDGNNNFQLKESFSNFILDESDFTFLQKRKLRKNLRRIRFKIAKGKEDILVFHSNSHLFGKGENISVLKVDSSEWKKWEKLINLIKKNIENFKLSIKKKELNSIYDDFKKIAYPKYEKNVIICEECGSENLGKALYCHYCGNKLIESTFEDTKRLF